MAVTYHRVEAGGPTPERFVVNGDGTFTPTRYIEGAVNVVLANEGYTTPEHTAVTVAVATAQAIDRNDLRIYLLLVNDGAAPIYLALGVDSQINRGIRLNANGGSYEMSALLGNLYTGTITCISVAGGEVLMMTEGV